jgi:hypothetical protein
MGSLYYIYGWVYWIGFAAGAVTFFGAGFPVECLYGERPVGELAMRTARFKVGICGCEESSPPMPFS